MSEQLVCVHLSRGTAGTLQAQGGDGVLQKLREVLARLLTMQCNGEGEGVIRWGGTKAVKVHQYRAAVSHWAPTGFPLGQDQEDPNLCPSSAPPFSLGQAGDKSFSLSFCRFVSVGVVNS